MNEKLAIEILTRIKNGMPGQHDIYHDIKKSPQYFTLKQQEFADTINELKEHECIKNLSSGHPKHFEIYHGKEDCLPKFEERIRLAESGQQEDKALKKLQADNLELSNRVLKLQIIDFKTKAYYTLFGIIIGGLIANLDRIILAFR